MTQATCELIWTRHLLKEIGVGDPGTMEMWCDNQAAIHIANNPIFQEWTKHIKVDFILCESNLNKNQLLLIMLEQESN